MRVVLSEWNEINFEEKLKESLDGLVKSVQNSEEIDRLFLINNHHPSEESVDPILVLNAIIGRLGRRMEIDGQLRLSEECFRSIKKLVLKNFSVKEFNRFIPFFSRHYYPFVNELVLECQAGCAQAQQTISCDEF